MKAKIVFNDHEYLIHLRKEDYSIDFLSQFISRIRQEEAFSRANQDEDFKLKYLQYSDVLRFDDLKDK